MTAQGLDCGVRSMDVISALHHEISRLYESILPNVGFHPQHPALMPQVFQPPFQEPLAAQIYQPSQQRAHLSDPVGHAHPTNPTPRAFDTISPIAQSIEAFAMTGNIEEAPQHGFMADMFNPTEPDPVVEAIRRLQTVQSTQMMSPRSPSLT